MYWLRQLPVDVGAVFELAPLVVRLGGALAAGQIHQCQLPLQRLLLVTHGVPPRHHHAQHGVAARGCRVRISALCLSPRIALLWTIEPHHLDDSFTFLWEHLLLLM